VRLSRKRHIAIVVGALLAWPIGAPVSAVGDDDGDELGDIAVPSEAPPRTPTLAPLAPPTGPLVDDFVYDDLVLEGTAAEVCYGSLRPGASRTYHEIVDRFGGSPGTMYSCRERWDVATNPDCNGTVVNPVTAPHFQSTCWSNHARGRAIDIMVGRVGTGYNTARGKNIVNWLLAADANGNPSAIARRLGVQQILFNDRCWNSDGDRGITSFDAMRACGIGHFDHVHLDLTEAGSMGQVSYWGGPVNISPKGNGMFLMAAAGGWHTIDWTLKRGTVTNSGTWSSAYDEVLSGDFDADGEVDDMAVWDKDSGAMTLLTWSGSRPAERWRGRWPSTYDLALVADLDGDGLMNDMFLRDQDSGNWMVLSWSGFAPTTRRTGVWSPVWDRIIPGDYDASAERDGVADDFFVWDSETGKWTVISWKGYVPANRSSGTWSRVYNQFIVGDFSAGGNLDDLIVRDGRTGSWRLLTFADYRPRNVRDGSWAAAKSQFFVGDFDTDGRYDELVLRDPETGAWEIVSWHRSAPSTIVTGRWSTPYVRFAIGSWS
jgi:hypothetical protein